MCLPFVIADCLLLFTGQGSDGQPALQAPPVVMVQDSRVQVPELASS
jgi:hypothetical protein